MEWALVTLSTLGIDAYARALASAAPTPGGGSASAVVGVLAASLAAMVARLTGDSPKLAALAPRMKTIAAEAERLSDAFLAAVDADVSAFDRVSAAYKLPKSTDAERAARSAAIQSALVGATDSPMHVVELGLQASRLAMELVDAGNPNAISDAGCAALFAQAAARGAALNIRINVKGLKDATLAASYQRKLDDLLAQIGILTEVAVVKAERVTERTP
jgi:formiminotetrahydrofolate cyclodeaminase